MIIDESILLEHGATMENYFAKEIIFRKGGYPQYYFQISDGTVELNNYHSDGKEFTLNILTKGQSIGESLLFGENNYPMNAVAKSDCRIIKLTKSKFHSLLVENRDVVLKLLEYLSDRLFYKYIMLFNNSANEPVAKIRALMEYFKKSAFVKGAFSYHLGLTRQQIANLTGLRVETVIRTLKKMEKDNLIRLRERKIFC